MNARTILGAVAALALAATAHADLIDVGTFANVSNDAGDYQGIYGQYVSWITIENGPVQIEVDVTGLLDALGYEAIAAIRVVDTGNNVYGESSSGADIDYFAMSNLSDGVGMTWSYDGPSPTHSQEVSAQLAQRVSAIDAQGGIHEWAAYLHVSLGELGSLTTTFSQPQGIHDDILPGVAGGSGTSPVLLHLREAGVGESFRVEIMTATIPAPGGLALLGLAALTGPSRRRKPRH